jgi:hypothetical protein
MLHAGRVLIVTDASGVSDYWAATLELDGYDTERCEGPEAATDCPRLHGRACSLRERADVAVVDLDCDEDARVCTRVPEDGRTVFVRRGDEPPIERAELSRRVEAALEHEGRRVQDEVKAPDEIASLAGILYGGR